MILSFPEAVAATISGALVLAYDPRDRVRHAKLSIGHGGELLLDGLAITAEKALWTFEEEGPPRLALTEVIQHLSSGTEGSVYSAADVFGTYSAYICDRDDASVYITIAVPRGYGAPKDGWQKTSPTKRSD